jgi:protein-cysteine N-palmitoyltransferase HHAT
MTLFSYVRSIYSLDTLDTRFTTLSTTQYKPSIDDRDNATKPNLSQDTALQEAHVKRDSSGQPLAQPSKWKSPEFYFYYLVLLTVVPYMFWVVYDVSRR